MRRALTIFELLVVVAVTAILIGLLIPAILHARTAALLAQSKNNVKQIVLGLHNIATGNNGRLPGTWSSEPFFKKPTLEELLPYVEQMTLQVSAKLNDKKRWWRRDYAQVPLYLNPLDPSFHAPNPNARNTSAFNHDGDSTDRLAVSSYALNATFFYKTPRLSQMTDGSSQTIWIAEHYGWNCGGTTFIYNIAGGGLWVMQPPTFAQEFGRPYPGPSDYIPITSGIPPISSAAGGKTFQVVPAMRDCDPRQPNASHQSGLQVGMGDGSVHVLAPSISPQTFWGMVTPAGGEAIQGFDY